MQRPLIGLILMVASTAVAGCDRSAPSRAEPPPISVAPTAPPASSAPAPLAPPPPSATAEPVNPIEAAPVASESPGRLDQVGHREEQVDPPPGPTGTVTIGNVSVTGASVSDAARVVARMRAGFRSCYNRSLHDDPTQHGELRLAIQVGPQGAVQAIDASPSGVLSAPLITCVRSRAHHGRFDITGGDRAIVAVSVTFATRSSAGGARTLDGLPVSRISD